MAKLRIVDGPLAGTEFVLGDAPMVAGRHIDCGIPIPDAKASRNHAEFLPDHDGQYSIIDIGSSNGTLVNGILLPPRIPRLLAGGDEIRMGQNTFRYFSGDARIPDLDIPGYTLEDLLAEGGMGSIIQARQKDTGQLVAVKILHGGYARHDEFVRRFIQEARAAGRLSHPNIVKVYHVGKTTNGRYFFTMELVKGSTLTQRIPNLPVSEGMRMLMEIADALDYAHRRGIIHRDIKPDNILIGKNEEPKLIDLGIAVLDRQDLDQPGPRVLGTPHYMSPEQASGRPITASTDIYSLGATFFHVFARQPLFDAPTPEQIMIKHVRERPRSLAEAAPSAPRDLTEIVDRMLARDPENRFADAGRLRDALAKVNRKRFPNMAIPQAIVEGRPRGLRIAAVVVLVLALIAALCLLFA